MSDLRTLPAGIFQHTYVVQKSRFLAYAKRVNDVQEAQAFLKSVALPDATHHCYAYVTLDTQKSSDNGEPAGTAGIPILQAIKQKNLTNVAVAVERYFGGIKLGTGGLARAYGQAASDVLEQVLPVCLRECVVLEFCSTYDQKDVVNKLIMEYGKVLKVDYTDIVLWRVAVPVLNHNLLMHKLLELYHGQVNVMTQEEHCWVEFLDD